MNINYIWHPNTPEFPGCRLILSEHPMDSPHPTFVSMQFSGALQVPTMDWSIANLPISPLSHFSFSCVCLTYFHSLLPALGLRYFTLVGKLFLFFRPLLPGASVNLPAAKQTLMVLKEHLGVEEVTPLKIQVLRRVNWFKELSCVPLYRCRHFS